MLYPTQKRVFHYFVKKHFARKLFEKKLVFKTNIRNKTVWRNYYIAIKILRRKSGFMNESLSEKHYAQQRV